MKIRQHVIDGDVYLKGDDVVAWLADGADTYAAREGTDNPTWPLLTHIARDVREFVATIKANPGNPR